MDSHTNQPRVLRFFDNFLQEHNIKWVLGIGMLLLLGSSLMLVGNQWQHYTPVWKYVIMLGYACVVYLGSQWSYHRLLLHKTGTVLMALTILLIPILFAALGWNPTSWVATTLLFGATMAFALLASKTIFCHFLREDQPTFRLAFLVLSAGGAVAPLVPVAAAPVAALFCWLVFAVGSVKVSRHVFWLVEKHRQPRILGFCPMLLLGAAFLLMFVSNFAAHIDGQWFGLGCALVALPVLVSTDRLAAVFEQRTGGIVRPLPLAIAAPLCVGLGLSAAAMGVAAIGLAGKPYALVPTSAVVATAMALVGRRTNKEPFIWAAILVGLVAYNFSPVFFTDLAYRIIHAGEVALSEERLPYAFYGLTYLPVIGSLIGLHILARRKQITILARPTRLLDTFLAAGLLAVSLTHAKATFPVAAAMVAVFAAQLRVFRQRRIAILLSVAALFAVFGAPAFFAIATGWHISVELTLILCAVVVGGLFLAGRRLDPWLDAGHDEPRHVLQLCSCVLAIGLIPAWTVTAVIDNHFSIASLLAAVAVLGLLVAQCMRWRHPGLSSITLVFVHTAAVLLLTQVDLGLEAIATVWTLLLLAQWAAGYGLARIPESAVAKVFGKPAFVISTALLSTVLALVHIPTAIADLLGANTSVPWWVRALVLVWSFDASRKVRNVLFAGVGSVALFLTAGAAWLRFLDTDAWEWLPPMWAGMALALVPLFGWLKTKGDAKELRCMVEPLQAVAYAILLVIGFDTLPALTNPLRLAGVTAAAGLLGMWFWVGKRRDVALIAAQWQLLATVLFFLTPATITTVLAPKWVVLATPLLVTTCAAAVLLSLTPIVWPGPYRPSTTLMLAHEVSLGAVVFCGLACSGLAIDALSVVPAIAAALSFAVLIFRQLYSACHKQLTWLVWAAEALAGAAVAYFAWHGIIHFGRGLSMFIVLGCALLMWGAGRLAERRPRTAILAPPFLTTAMILPAVTVVIGFYRHLIRPEAGWLGINSLGLLLAAGYYFWQGLERDRARLLVLAAGILNVALAFLWRDLSWSDPQFYMIPVGISVLALARMLRHEIPAHLHDPLYYAGALVILVSPTFNIVHGSWAHLLTLMVCSVAMVLVAIGLRLRALVYAGAAFLIADLVAMVVRGSIDNPNILWLAGLTLGAAVIGLGAVAERNRELVLQRIRMLSAELKVWN